MAFLMMLLAVLCVVGAFTLDGGHISALLAPTAALLVIGGTICVVAVSFPISDLKKIPAALKRVASTKDKNYESLISYFSELAGKARKEGMLSLESESQNMSVDPFIRRGLQLLTDGFNETQVKAVLEQQAAAEDEEKKIPIKIFEAAGGFAPTLGILGTVTGLVHVLGNLSDPDSLGPSIAVGFLATLYGLSTANIIYLPIANRLKALSSKDEVEREMIIEAVLSIRDGISPKVLEEKLRSFLP